MKLNTGFLKRWSKNISESVCKVNNVDSNNLEEKAILGYNLAHPDAQIQKRRKVITLYHGSSERTFQPILDHGNINHDFGQGFYLTDNLKLAREWSVSYDQSVGYVHVYELDTTDLKILDFRTLPILHWVAEIMSHRNAKTMQRYCRQLSQLLDKYKVDTTMYDVLIGHRADASHFSIVKAFIQNQLDFTLLDKTLDDCESGTQYLIRTPKALEALHVTHELEEIDKGFSSAYNNRDLVVRMKLNKILYSKANTLEVTFKEIMAGVYD